jgi:hypothetical protein
MFNQYPGGQYHATEKAEPWYVAIEGRASDEDLEKWANDPLCIEQAECARALAKRQEHRARLREAARSRAATKRAELDENPFDPRTEVSADAQHIAGQIVKHLWILFVLLPIIAFVLYGVLSSIK